MLNARVSNYCSGSINAIEISLNAAIGTFHAGGVINGILRLVFPGHRVKAVGADRGGGLNSGVRRAAFAAAPMLFANLLVCALPIAAQSRPAKQPLITQAVGEQKLVTLHGSIRPEAGTANDLGPVPDNLLLNQMCLQLRRAPGEDEAAKALIDRLHDPQAPEYHRWLTADEVAERFGPSEADVRTISGWLESHGFTVNMVYRQNGVIDFSGPASAVREAFHTEIHQFLVKGNVHIANASDPKIPAALAPAVLGVVSMNDFRPKPALVPRAQYTFPAPGYTAHAVVPGDLHTIYNFNPLYTAGITGAGQSIVVLEDSNVYNPGDWKTFRSKFGLATQFPLGSFRQVHPRPSNASGNGGPCADPGLSANGDEIESIIDAEWASAAAPNAEVVLASCASTNTSFGAFIALQNLLTGPSPRPGIVSLSYEMPETISQASPPYQAYVTQLYQLAVLQGVSIFVGAGDSGGAAADLGAATAESGVTVNGYASTPYNVAVGGTDFGDLYLGESAQYWNAKNGKYLNSALSYIPEIPLNDSCASRLLANYLGYSTPYGTDGLCNASAFEEYLNTSAGGGGPSGCATGTPSTYGADEAAVSGEYAVVSGTCKGYAKPLFQISTPGNPNDGVRDLPDVSLFAADGTWGHYYIFCDSDPADAPYGAPCTGAPSTWTGGGGTSFAAPVMAGIQALVNQTAGSHQGNPNYILYALSAREYGFSRAAACDASLGGQVDSACIFQDVTLGDNDVPCQLLEVNGVSIGAFNCYKPGGTYGVLSRSNRSYKPAWPATPGWDFATGLGSVNAFNLVKAWPGSKVP